MTTGYIYASKENFVRGHNFKMFNIKATIKAPEKLKVTGNCALGKGEKRHYFLENPDQVSNRSQLFI